MKSFIALAFLICCAIWGDAASLPTISPLRKQCSQPLVNSDTWNNLMAVAKHVSKALVHWSYFATLYFSLTGVYIATEFALNSSCRHKERI